MSEDEDCRLDVLDYVSGDSKYKMIIVDHLIPSKHMGEDLHGWGIAKVKVLTKEEMEEYYSKVKDNDE